VTGATDLLVVCGEASGDRAAAGVLTRLGHPRAFGLGGAACAAAGMELVGDIREWTALGVGEAIARGGRVWSAWRSLGRAIRAKQPRAALLVNYSEFNAHLAPRLHARGTRVLWYGAPQIWAWRAGRATSLRGSIDRMAVMLPFEEALWRSQGVDAHYVGHPALEGDPLDRAAARDALGLTRLASAVAVLPGSRPHEVRALLVPFLDAYASVMNERASVDARVLVAPSLDAATRQWVERESSGRGVRTFEVDAGVGAGALLRAFDVALCASGTASLEAAIARAVPIVAYRVGLATEIAARALLRVPHVALPNVLLGRASFPELLQRDASAGRIALGLADMLDRRAELVTECDAVEASLLGEREPSRRVARMLAPWLGRSQAA
jgi:lipid-A-disaccharide synthase